MNLILTIIPILFIISILIAIFAVLGKVNANQQLDKTQRLFWILIIISIPFLGSVAYLNLHRNQKI
jgi:hypothetical protein